jgi:hypothetical protein
VFTTVAHHDLAGDGESHPGSRAHAYASTTFPELALHLEEAGFRAVETPRSRDARATSPAAVPALDDLHARGYRVVTVGELLAREAHPTR